jgi:endo-1,4-beta-mannosidase
MDRRKFILSAASAAIPLAHSASWAERSSGGLQTAAPDKLHRTVQERRRDLRFHRFGVNYTPSHNWWFCWNDWDIDPIKRDLDALAALKVDHLRIFPIWPFFQPNPTWVSTVHLERLSQLLAEMALREMDAVVTVFTGQLSGPRFLPSFNKTGAEFYTDKSMWDSQELYVRALAAMMKSHENIIGFDFGNEMETCWSAPLPVGDAWMARMFALMHDAYPAGLNLNGASYDSWFRQATFSPQALAKTPIPVMHSYPYWSDSLKYGGPMDPPSTRLMPAFAALIRAYAGDRNKAVWAAEFNTCIEELSEKQQAVWLEKAVTEAIAGGVCWYTYWDSHDTNRKFKFNTLEYSLGLFTNDGRLKEQGVVFKELAEAYRGKLVISPAKEIPPPPDALNDQATWAWLLEYLEWKQKPSPIAARQ